MKSLKRMLLINWHYINKQILDFENINFLTGKNGSGKSTIIDAMQLVILGDTRGTFFNKAANDRTDRTLEGYLKGELGDDGDSGFKYIRNGRFSSFIVCEFYDKVTRKSFCLGVVFDIYKDSDIEKHFFSLNNKIPENEFVGEDNIPFSYNTLKSYFAINYRNNYDFYSSNNQYQNAIRGKLGGLNQKFFSLFQKAVTFTPINDIEKFIVEYVCDVKNKIDITSMQENIRQYSSLSKQVEILKVKENQLQEIENLHNRFIEEISNKREEQYLIWRAEKQLLIDELENLNKELKDKKTEKETIQKETKKLEDEQNILDDELSDLLQTRANSDIAKRTDELSRKKKEINTNIKRIEDLEQRSIKSFRNHSLKWKAKLSRLEQIKNNIVADEIKELSSLKDLLNYLDNINENNFSNLEITAIEEIREKVGKLIKLGNIIFSETNREYEEACRTKQSLEKDIDKLNKGKNPYEQELISFKAQLEDRLQEKFGKKITTYFLADLLEIKNEKWQNAIEGYLNTQKKYIIIEPEFFEEASKIYRQLGRESSKIHSFGIVDIGKIQKDNNYEANSNSLATEILTENKLAKIYIDYLLGRVIKVETIEELRKNKISITSDCMLYQSYSIRKINPNNYKYPIIGKEALKRQKQIKEQELKELMEKIEKEENIISIMDNIKQMFNFSEDDISNINYNIEEAKKKDKYLLEVQELQKELDGMDMFWLNSISNKIQQKQEEKSRKEALIKENNKRIGNLEAVISNEENEKIPSIETQIQQKNNQINEEYFCEWQDEIGEEKYGVQALKKTPEKIIETFCRVIKNTANKIEKTKQDLENKKSDYNKQHMYSFDIHDLSNKQFSEQLKQLKEIDLPNYLEKIQDSREKAYEQFRIEFLDKLKSNIDEVREQINNLNSALGEHKFGTDTYKFKMSPKKEHKRFYDMLQDELLLGDWGIGQEQFNKKYEHEIKELFDKVTTTDSNENSTLDKEYEKNIKEYTDYTTYLNFDLIVKDKTGNEQRLSKTLLKKSGGETQTPFYISILASFAQVYRIKNQENTVRLIVFDEAFSKMDNERIEESIKLLRKIGFQAIFAAPPEKLQDIQDLVDSTYVVMNPEEHEIIVRKYTNKEEF